jgi:hypothetical protein
MVGKGFGLGYEDSLFQHFSDWDWSCIIFRSFFSTLRDCIHWLAFLKHVGLDGFDCA